MGSIDRPFNPINFALGANATFVARTIDTHVKHMAEILKAAAAHEGTSFVEIYQNCLIFNDGCFDDVVDPQRQMVYAGSTSLNGTRDRRVLARRLEQLQRRLANGHKPGAHLL